MATWSHPLDHFPGFDCLLLLDQRHRIARRTHALSATFSPSFPGQFLLLLSSRHTLGFVHFSDEKINAYAVQFGSLVLLPQNFQLLLFLHLQIRKLLNFRLIKTVDYRIFSLWNKDFLDLQFSWSDWVSAIIGTLTNLSWIFEWNLTNCHAPILL